MIGLVSRNAYYVFMAIPMRINGALYRRFRAPRAGTVKVHLGPGREKYLDGWINVDANIFTAKADVLADLRNPLPFPDSSVDIFYSHHVIEHLPDSLLPFHFAEMYRCLKPGGVFRIGGPHGDNAAAKLIAGDTDWFLDMPDNRASVGGRFANFILCGGQHLTILTLSYLAELATAAGFRNVRACQPCTETFHRPLIDDAVLKGEWPFSPECPHTLIVEADKCPAGN
jgi:SAM-dependent methyltransferase